MIQAHYIQAHLLLCGPIPNRPDQHWSEAWTLGTHVLEGMGSEAEACHSSKIVELFNLMLF